MHERLIEIPNALWIPSKRILVANVVIHQVITSKKILQGKVIAEGAWVEK